LQKEDYLAYIKILKLIAFNFIVFQLEYEIFDMIFEFNNSN